MSVPFGRVHFLKLLVFSLLVLGQAAGRSGVLGGSRRSEAPAPAVTQPYPLEAKAASLLKEDAWVRDWRPTGIAEDYYAAVSEPIVRQAVAWQEPGGRIIDPYVGYETPTATPRFVGALAGLMLKGRCLDLADNGIRALTAAAADLYAAREKPLNGSEFYPKELMLGYLALRDRADGATVGLWKKYLGGFDPEANYGVVLGKRPAAELHNYTTFALAGEEFKKRYGIADNGAFIERHLATQLPRFTAFGMYRDPVNPMVYDAVARMNLSLFVFFGYDGPQRAALEEMLRRGALTMLLYMSPTGECPYGGRSNQQNFNEATAALLFEYEAARRKKAGDAELAGIFKRAARLAALSVKRWLDLRPVGFIKNEYPAATQHGRQKGYGFYGVYSLLIASQFGFAGFIADPDIGERPVPWERGAYVIALDEDFHKVFAACRGYGLEIDTKADHHYDATGLGRLHKFGVPTETALSVPIVAKPEYLVSTPEAPRNIAIGPGWESGGRSQWLSDLSGEIERVGLETLSENKERVKFRVDYDCGPSRGSVRETYELDAKGLTINWEIGRLSAGSPEEIRIQVPLLETDGHFRSRIGRDERSFMVDYQGHVYRVAGVSPRKVQATLETFAAPNRNGTYRVGILAARGRSATCRFSLD